MKNTAVLDEFFDYKLNNCYGTVNQFVPITNYYLPIGNN